MLCLTADANAAAMMSLPRNETMYNEVINYPQPISEPDWKRFTKGYAKQSTLLR